MVCRVFSCACLCLRVLNVFVCCDCGLTCDVVYLVLNVFVCCDCGLICDVVYLVLLCVLSVCFAFVRCGCVFCLSCIVCCLACFCVSVCVCVMCVFVCGDLCCLICVWDLSVIYRVMLCGVFVCACVCMFLLFDAVVCVVFDVLCDVVCCVYVCCVCVCCWFKCVLCGVSVMYDVMSYVCVACAL